MIAIQDQKWEWDPYTGKLWIDGNQALIALPALDVDQGRAIAAVPKLIAALLELKNNTTHLTEADVQRIAGEALRAASALPHT